MTGAKDPEHAEAEARMQNVIVEFKNRPKKEDPRDRKSSV